MALVVKLLEGKCNICMSQGSMRDKPSGCAGKDCFCNSHLFMYSEQQNKRKIQLNKNNILV
jgi:hypothetical protein